MDDDIGGGYTNDDGGDEYKSNGRGDVNDGGNNGAADGNNADGDVMRRMVVIRMYTIIMLMLDINLDPSASFRYKKEGKKAIFKKFLWARGWLEMVRTKLIFMMLIVVVVIVMKMIEFTISVVLILMAVMMLTVVMVIANLVAVMI